MPENQVITSEVNQPTILCQCGCGQPVTPAIKTEGRRGVVKGQPNRFAKNHNGRALSPLQYIEDTRTGCWNWQRHIGKHGYGTIYYKGHSGRLAHRIYFELKHGPIPVGKFLDHLCRNRACVNPDHLEVVTQTTNVRRGLSPKITKEKADQIRRKRAATGVSQQKLADQYGISQKMISNILLNKWWRD